MYKSVCQVQSGVQLLILILLVEAAPPARRPSF